MDIRAKGVRVEPDMRALKHSFNVAIEFFAEKAVECRIFDSQAEVEFRSGETTKKIGRLNWAPQDINEEVIKENFFHFTLFLNSGPLYH